MNAKNSKRLLLIVVGIGLLLFVIWNRIGAQSSEPIYQGKPESYWINSLRYPVAIDRPSRISLLGSNELPVLLKAVEMQNGTNAAAIRTNAAIILSWKGNLEILLPLAKESKDPHVRAIALGGIISKNENTVAAALVDALNDKAASVRRVAVMGLGHAQRKQIPEQLPALVRCLNDADHYVCYLAASSLSQFHVNFPGQDRRTIAEAASEEIKSASNHPNAVVKNAATKAMNKNSPYADLRTFARELAISLAELDGQTWMATVRAIDQQGMPIEGADVSITYYVPAFEDGDTFSSLEKIEGKTGSNGVFTASHRDSSKNLNFLVQKAGFSTEKKNLEKNGIHPAGNGGGVKFLLPSAASYFQTASNVDLTVTLTLQKLNSTK